MNKYFHGIHGNFGFGCMRLPMRGDEVDTDEFTRMVDAFLEAGFNYFDTAHGYLSGKSEPALRQCLTSRYPRDRYVLTTKLSGSFFTCEADIRPLFERQLADCGVDHFDFYLMHAQSANNYGKFKACRAYETAFALRDEGKIRHLGLSFHDRAEMLETILNDYPQIEVVQLQFNYLDYEDASVQGRRCYEVCRAHGKPVIVMEPVKGGSLVRLPSHAQEVFDALHGGSNASYALRYAAGFDGIAMVLSGMGSMAMMRDNLETMTAARPLSEEERRAIDKVRGILCGEDLISCTACRYCTDGCPQRISIPDWFSALNEKRQAKEASVPEGGPASACVRCGKCESICPQHLPIRTLLQEAARDLENA